MLLYCKMGNIFNPSFRLFAQRCKSTPYAKALENGNPAKARTCRRQYSSTTAHLGTWGAFKRAFGLHVIIYLANFNHLLRKRVITAPPRISEVQYTRCDWTVFGGVVLSFDGQLNPAVNHITLCGCEVDHYQPAQVFDHFASVNSSAWIHFERPQISMGTQQLWPAWFETAYGSFNLFLLIIPHEKTQSVFVKVSMRPVILYNYTTFCQSFQIDCSVSMVVICTSQWPHYLELSKRKKTTKKQTNKLNGHL